MHNQLPVQTDFLKGFAFQNLPEKEVAIDLYKTILKIRCAEEMVVQLYPTDKIQSPIHLCIGEEAVAAGVCRSLNPNDRIYGTYRSHGIYLACGGDLRGLFAELYAKDTGCARGKGGSMHLIATEKGLMGCSAIVASTIPLAVGDALASSLQGRTRVVVSFFGDGAVGEGVFYESLNFASLKNLPVIFVCVNNNYAVHSRIEDRHKQTDFYRYGEPFGIHGYRYDGNDVNLVYLTMKDTVEKIKAGAGPFLVEYVAYRIYDHVGPGKDHREAYRSQTKLKEALANDSLAKSKMLLQEKYGVLQKDLEVWKREIDAEIEDAVRFAEESPYPSSNQLHEHLFAEDQRR